MISPAFMAQLALSFLVGGLWVALSTVIAERFGTRLGGLVAGLPSTVVITLLFIGLTQGPAEASEATTVMPLVQGLNGLMIVVFLALARRGLAAALLAAASLWSGAAVLLLAVRFSSFPASVTGWLGLLAVCVWVVGRGMSIRSRPGTPMTFPARYVLFRALFGGTVISLAVLLGKTGGPLIGGVFAAFPAVFISTLVLSHLGRGPEFSRAVGKSLLLSGMISVPLYSIAVRYAYPARGLVAGTLLALLVAALIAFLLHRLTRPGDS